MRTDRSAPHRAGDDLVGSDASISPESRFLRALARRLVAEYALRTDMSAALLTGSSALGVSDTYSDLDLVLFYATLPDETALAAVCSAAGGERRRDIAPPEAGSRTEHYFVDGVECQLAHVTLADWERTMERVLSGEEPGSPEQKALSGLLYGLPLHGEQRIRAWQTQATYPAALQEAVVRHYLAVPAVWYLRHQFLSRDAGIWLRSELVQVAQGMLGTLAGINRVYYAPFQLKHTAYLVAQLAIAPPDLTDRLERLLVAPPAEALDEAERLVAQTVALAEKHLPQVDTSAARRLLGRCQQPWSLPDDTRTTAGEKGAAG